VTDAKTVRTTALIRLAIGLIQGIALFLLQKADESKAWPATAPMLYAPLLVCALMVPLLPLAALSAMRRMALIAWTAIAAALAAILAIHAAWTGAEPDRLGAGPLSRPMRTISTWRGPMRRGCSWHWPSPARSGCCCSWPGRCSS